MTHRQNTTAELLNMLEF